MSDDKMSAEARYLERRREVLGEEGEQRHRDSITTWAKSMLEASKGFEHSGAYTGSEVE